MRGTLVRFFIKRLWACSVIDRREITLESKYSGEMVATYWLVVTNFKSVENEHSWDKYDLIHPLRMCFFMANQKKLLAAIHYREMSVRSMWRQLLRPAKVLIKVRHFAICRRYQYHCFQRYKCREEVLWFHFLSALKEASALQYAELLYCKHFKAIVHRRHCDSCNKLYHLMRFHLSYHVVQFMWSCDFSFDLVTSKFSFITFW